MTPELFDKLLEFHIPPHLLTLLASDPGDLKDPENAEQVSELARSLVRLLIAIS